MSKSVRKSNELLFHGNSLLSQVISWGGALTTLAVNPWTNLDPINLPKMTVLSVVAMCTLLYVLTNLSFFQLRIRPLGFLILFFIFGSLVAFYSSEKDKEAQLWGEWGRNTGLLTYLCFVILIYIVALLRESIDQQAIFNNFIRLSYLIFVYALIQIMDLDPIPWSQNGPFATLGNINFSSGFLGLAVIAIFCKSLFFAPKSLLTNLFSTICILSYVSLILFSGSIQGVAVAIAGCAVAITIKIYLSGRALTSAIFLTLVFALQVTGLLSLLGLGPFGQKFMQYSVVFRMDYWKAGIEMFIAGPMVGHGFDTYGDLYRQFRDSAAVERTGSQRVTNTAHNIFIDVATNGGILTVLPFLLLFLLPLVLAMRNIILKNCTHEEITLLSLVFGFLVYSAISINQIGVGIWGFIFLGALYANVVKFSGNPSQKSEIHGQINPRLAQKQNNQNGSSARDIKLTRKGPRNLRALPLLFGVMSGLLLAWPAFKTDIEYLSAARQTSINERDSRMSELLYQRGASDFHWERYIELLRREGRTTEGAELAKTLVKRNPNNFLGWTYIWLGTSFSDSETLKVAAANLKRLDPKNTDLHRELERVLKSLPES